MRIQRLELTNFRSFTHTEIKFERPTTVIVGPNAAGKTNILEAIYLLATGKSFRAGHEEEMVREGEEIARVAGQISSDEEINLEVVLTRGILQGTKVARKKVSVNGVSKRLFNFAGNLRSVLFGPQDLDLITGSPSGRRRFLDGVLSQVDREYRRSLLSYEKGVRQRNKVLERIREGEAGRSQLLFWDKLLIKNGNYITQKRQEFIDFANSTESFAEEDFSLEYDKSTISEARIAQYAEEEISASATLVGPHRDDVQFVIRKTQNAHRRQGLGGQAKRGGKNLATFGSRGEQRMGVLWIKLAEISFIERATHSASSGQAERPVLLLDDIFSELDHKHHEVVMSVIGKQQTILTTADPHNIEGWKKEAQIMEL